MIIADVFIPIIAIISTPKYDAYMCMDRQGIWADGPLAAWNGDYHMNINTQMQYWATNSAGSAGLNAPFLSFMRSIAEKGVATAQRLYGCKRGGWVAHGFTDSSMQPDLYGQPEWVCEKIIIINNNYCRYD